MIRGKYGPLAYIAVTIQQIDLAAQNGDIFSKRVQLKGQSIGQCHVIIVHPGNEFSICQFDPVI